MPSILSKSQIFNFSPRMVDDENRIGEQIEMIVEELKVIYAARDIDHREPEELMEKVQARFGFEFADKLWGCLADEGNLHAEAGFALGYFTAKHPEWLIFAQPEDNDQEPIP